MSPHKARLALLITRHPKYTDELPMAYATRILSLSDEQVSAATLLNVYYEQRRRGLVPERDRSPTPEPAHIIELRRLIAETHYPEMRAHYTEMLIHHGYKLHNK